MIGAQYIWPGAWIGFFFLRSTGSQNSPMRSTSGLRSLSAFSTMAKLHDPVRDLHRHALGSSEGTFIHIAKRMRQLTHRYAGRRSRSRAQPPAEQRKTVRRESRIAHHEPAERHLRRIEVEQVAPTHITHWRRLEVDIVKQCIQVRTTPLIDNPPERSPIA